MYAYQLLQILLFIFVCVSKNANGWYSFLVLYEHQPNLGLELLNEDPEKCLSEWDSATLRAQMSLLKEVDGKCELKTRVHCRIYQLPAWSLINRTVFPDKKDVGKFLQISGRYFENYIKPSDT